MNKNPWVGIGTAGEWTDSQTALIDAGLDYDVEMVDAYTIDNVRIPNIMATRVSNNSTGLNIHQRRDVLGSVSPRYGLVQNQQAFLMMDMLCKNGAVITNAGETENGMVFMVAKLITFNTLGEPHELYVFATNSFNGKFAINFIFTPIRVRCQNMYRMLMNNSVERLTMPHKAHLANSMDSLASICDQQTNFLRGWEDTINKMFRARLSDTQASEVLNHIFPKPNDEGKRFEAMQEKREEMIELFNTKYLRAQDNLDYVGTAYGMLNAYTDWLSHSDVVAARASIDQEHSRLTGLVTGRLVNENVINLLKAA